MGKYGAEKYSVFQDWLYSYLKHLVSLKVARVVNIKLGFMDWFFCYLLILVSNGKSHREI